MRLIEALFGIALVLYSLAIWSHQLGKEKQLRWRTVLVFGAALKIDAGATFFLCFPAAKTNEWNLHAVTGFASLAIMALHFLWALAAFRFRGKHEIRFSRWSPYAWGFWLIAFFSGMPWMKFAAAAP